MVAATCFNEPRVFMVNDQAREHWADDDVRSAASASKGATKSANEKYHAIFPLVCIFAKV